MMKQEPAEEVVDENRPREPTLTEFVLGSKDGSSVVFVSAFVLPPLHDMPFACGDTKT